MKFLILISLNAIFFIASPFLIKSPQNRISFLGIEEKNNLNKDSDRKILIDLEKLANDEILLISKRKELTNQKSLFDSYNLSLQAPKDDLFANISNEEIRNLPKIHNEQRFIMQEVKMNDSNVTDNNTSNFGEGLGIFVIKTETNPETKLQNLTISQENMTKNISNETVIEQSMQNLTNNEQKSKNETENGEIKQNDNNKQNDTLNDTKANPKEAILNITINLETVSLPCDNLTEVENFIEKKAENNTLTDITKLFLNNSSNGTNNSQIIILFVTNKDKKSEGSSEFRESNAKIKNPNTGKLEKNLEDLISLNSISDDEISDSPPASSSEILKLDEIVSSSLLGKNREKVQLFPKIPEKEKNYGSNETEKSSNSSNKQNLTTKNGTDYKTINQNSTESKKNDSLKEQKKMESSQKIVTPNNNQFKDAPKIIPLIEKSEPKTSISLFSQNSSKTIQDESNFSSINKNKKSQNFSNDLKNDSLNFNDDSLKLEDFPAISNETSNLLNENLSSSNQPKLQQKNILSEEKTKIKTEATELSPNENLIKNHQNQNQNEDLFSYKTTNETINEKKPDDVEVKINPPNKEDQKVEFTPEKMETLSKIQENVESAENKEEEKITKLNDLNPTSSEPLLKVSEQIVKSAENKAEEKITNSTSSEPLLKVSQQIKPKENILSEIVPNETKIDLFQNKERGYQNITADKKNESVVKLDKVERKEPFFKPLDLKEVKQVPPNIFATPITIQEITPKSPLKSKETPILSDNSENNRNFETMGTSENLEVNNEALHKSIFPQEIQETVSQNNISAISPKESNESLTMNEKQESNSQNSSLRMISLKNISENETYQYSESPSIVDNLPSVIRQRTEPIKMTSAPMLNTNESPLKSDNFVEIRKMSIPTSLARNQGLRIL